MSAYWLHNASVPQSLLQMPAHWQASPQGLHYYQQQDKLVGVHILIKDNLIAEIYPASHTELGDIPIKELHHNLVLPCFVDMHTHLDKGHMWQRQPNLRCDFQGALSAVWQDYQNWHYEDVYRRMDFGLQCSYAHGTKAVRTHLDCPPQLLDIVIPVFQDLQKQWSGKIDLQAVSLVSLDTYMGDYGQILADRVAEIGGILGGVAYMHDRLDTELDHLIHLARERHLDLDLHTDENGDPRSRTLWHTAQSVIKNNFPNAVVCGHCCSLSVQSPAIVQATINLLADLNMGIVSLPLCNLYLQDRHDHTTPRWRGITDLHALRQANIPTALASDNCRDPFYNFGDHDLLQVLAMAVQIGHLDRPCDDWIGCVNQIPARLMTLPDPAQIQVGAYADLIIFPARFYSELFSRPHLDRQIIRQGKFIKPALPSYRDLDDVICL
jgi:cytosine deaminase